VSARGLKPIVLAIDGPASSGKSSVAKGVAKLLDFDYVDTGAMYRAVTWAVLEEGVDLSDAAKIGECAQQVAPKLSWSADPSAPRISIGAVDITRAIREPNVTAAVSAVSAVPATRAALVAHQRNAVAAAQAAGRGVVMEGRDIGTVVLPSADVKVWLYADPMVRAARRVAEDQSAGRASAVGVEEMAADLARRDAADSSRADSPTRQAEDAVGLDATHLDLTQVIDSVVALIEAQGTEKNLTSKEQS